MVTMLPVIDGVNSVMYPVMNVINMLMLLFILLLV
jgi:hypothetical protein